MPNPLVSVVLPTYKRPDRLRRAARSVSEQTYQNIELLVVDDCSPTPARDSLSSVPLGDVEVTHIRLRTNSGANQARNTGIRNASGEFVAFLDDDDEWKPQKIQRQVEIFQRAESDVGVVYTGAEYMHGEYSRTEIYDSRGDVTRDLLMGESLGEFSMFMVRRDVIKSAGLPDPNLPSWQDREWSLRLSENCAFEPVTEPLTVRWCGDDTERISDNYEEKRDISYPYLLDKHRGLAASYGWRYERGFVASLSDLLGRTALRNGYYRDARRYFLKACYYYPVSTDRLLYAAVSLGGNYTYTPLSRLVRTLHGLSN